MKPTKRNQRTLFIIILAALILMGAGGGYYYIRMRSAGPKQASTPVVKPPDETRALIEKIGRLIVLPTNEEPTVATVEDPKKLKGQAFFANAKTGDKVLIYAKARKAILYSPTLDKIIEVAPINLGGTTTSSPR